MRHVTHCDFGWLSPSSQLSPIHIYFPRLSCLIKFPYLHLKIFVLQGSPRIFQILSFCYATGQHNKSCVVCLLPVSLIHKFLRRVFSKFSPELGESSVNTSGQPPSLIDTAGCRPRNYSEVTQKCRFYLSVARHHSAHLRRQSDQKCERCEASVFVGRQGDSRHCIRALI